jgi:hypothetical protein
MVFFVKNIRSYFSRQQPDNGDCSDGIVNDVNDDDDDDTKSDRIANEGHDEKEVEIKHICTKPSLPTNKIKTVAKSWLLRIGRRLPISPSHLPPPSSSSSSSSGSSSAMSFRSSTLSEHNRKKMVDSHLSGAVSTSRGNNRNKTSIYTKTAEHPVHVGVDGNAGDEMLSPSTERSSSSPPSSAKKITKTPSSPSPSLIMLRLHYLIVILTIMLADGLQGKQTG